MARPITDARLTRLGGWPAGVNNVRDLRDLQRGKPEDRAVRAAVNVDFSSSGKPRRRKGYTLVQSGFAHSLYAPSDWPLALLVLDGMLTALRNEGGAEALTALGGLSTTAKAAYCVQNEWIYGSNGHVTFRVSRDGVLGAWGVPMPQGMPVATPITDGSLPAGRYQIALTYLDAAGEESGARAPMLVELPADGGIALSAIPQPAGGVASIRLYLTPHNGTELYHAATVPVGVTDYTLYSVKDLGKGLETLHCERVPPARWLASYRGRIYFAIGDTLYYTLPLRFGLFQCHKTYLRFPHRINAVAATDDALIVGTEHMTYRLAGDDPVTMTMLPIDSAGVVEGAMLELPGGVLPGERFNVRNVVWWSKKGVLMRALPGGITVPVTQGRLAVARYASGALMYREHDEIAQLVTVLRGPQAPTSFAAQDRADATIVRNGIEL
jgi:hypothetical protein